jgi:hypothetical protein
MPGDAVQRCLEARGGVFRIVGLARHDCQDPALVGVSPRLKPGNRFEVKSVANGEQSAVGHRYPAVIVHRLDDARLALSVGQPVTLLSAPGAALYAGCGWWRALARRARAEAPGVPVADILDCGDGAGQALAALRIGQRHLVLSPGAPGWDAVAAIAAGFGGEVLRQAPPALDLAQRGAGRQLPLWLGGPTTAGGSGSA